jgi:L-idonate 5-dehydrogenase
MQFFGSAMFKPHSQGGFRDLMVVEESQCVSVGSEVTLGEAACAEPLSVAVHAVNQAGSLVGRRVLVTGVGPIGALVVAMARYAGAQEIVATDLSEAPLKAAAAMGADMVINGSLEPQRLSADYSANKGAFDVVFECSGAGAVLKQVFALTRPRGTIVQVGVMGETAIPMNALVGKEINLMGTHRANKEFAIAAQLIRDRRIDVRPIISSTVPMERIGEAFELARDRSSQMKVQLSFA